VTRRSKVYTNNRTTKRHEWRVDWKFICLLKLQQFPSAELLHNVVTND